jgi:hypothetical protein
MWSKSVLRRNVMRKFVSSFAALAAVLVISALPASAEQINLQYTTFGGNTPTTEGPLTPAMGTAVVNGNSAILTSNNAEVGAVTMDTNGLNNHADFVSLFFDIKVLSQAATGYGQAFGGAQTLGGVRIVQNGIFAESFQLMPTSATTGYFAFRDATNSSAQSFGPIGDYNINTTYHIQLDADYTHHIANAYINGILATPGGYALRPGTGPGGTTSEIFVYLNGAAGSDVHNSFQIGDTAAVPIPSTASMGFVAFGCLAFAKRYRRTATAKLQLA